MIKHAYASLISLRSQLKELVRVERNISVNLGQCDTVKDDSCSRPLCTIGISLSSVVEGWCVI
jgi:hypothetical protein